MSSSGKVYLIGAGPGDPELLTVKAARLLASADVVLHDDLVTDAVLALVNSRACVVNVGKRCGRKSITQSGIHKLMIDCAHQSLSVARLKSGDPLVFGRAGEEMDALRAAGLEFEVIPGITAAFAAAAAIPCSLTDRRAASSILLTSGHRAPADSEPESTEPTRVVYMPGRDMAQLAERWHEEGLPADLPCAVISHAARPDQQVVHTTLADLAHTRPGPAPVLVIGGFVLSRAASEESSPHNSAKIHAPAEDAPADATGKSGCATATVTHPLYD
jgi:uroporphyrin-III C-methyltransferase